MKVLFAAANSRDYLAGCLWDGLRSALGPDNVADAVDSAYLRGLHEDWSGPDPSAVLLVCPNGNAKRGQVYDEPHRLPEAGEDDFGLLVAVTSFEREHPSRQIAWEWLEGLKERHLRKGGKVAYVETLDSPAEVFPPQWPVGAVFRREIDPAVPYARHYGQKPLPLLGAAPRRWFDWPQGDKVYDVFAVSSAVTPLPGWPERWESLRRVWDTHTKHTSLAGSGALPLGIYISQLCRSKLCVVAPGGGNSSDSPRHWEAVAAASVPVFVGQPCRVRWPWFADHEIFWARSPEYLPAAIDAALMADLPAMRQRLREHALAEHTTEARARQFLELIEADAWRRWDKKPWCW